MLGARYIENNPLIERERQRVYDLHQKKLHHIQSSYTKKRKVVEDPLFKMQRIHETKERNHHFRVNERTALINKGNELLLNKLVEISNRKKSSPHSLNPMNPYKSLLHSHASKNGKSLNELVRRNQEMEILRENTNIARRILSKEPFLDARKFDDEYQAHLKYKKNLRKKLPSSPQRKDVKPAYKGRLGHMPPMQYRSSRGKEQMLKKDKSDYILRNEEEGVSESPAPKALSMGNIHESSGMEKPKEDHEAEADISVPEKGSLPM